MKRMLYAPLIAGLFFWSCSVSAYAQNPGGSPRPPEVRVDPLAGPGGVNNTLLGELKLRESRSAAGPAPRLQVILYHHVGREVTRQSVSPNGSYYFNNVPNGEYYLAIESSGVEIARHNFRLAFIINTEVRHDFEMEWRGGEGEAGGKISTVDFYQRSPSSQKLFDQAQAALSRKDYPQAITLFRQVVGADDQDYQAWTSLGTAYTKAEKLGEAEKALSRALSAKPDFLLAQINHGRLLFVQKKYEAAIEPLAKAVAADPQSPEANYLLGESYLQIKKGSKAVGYLNEAIRLDPTGMAQVHLRLATLYRAAGLKDRAVAEYEQFLTKRPDHPEKQTIEQFIKENKPR
jgi:tetratricopeptide (TPR) repeat protein